MTVQITAGFLPLTDALLLIAAREKGFAEEEGIALTLRRESSWANIRDRLWVGHFDVAHLLAPMPVASALGLSPLPDRFIGAMALGHGGNAVTVGNALWSAMAAAGALDDLGARAAGAALRRVVDERGTRLRFGVVHPHSSHNYELRYWLAASGVEPGEQAEIVVLPPPLLPDALQSGVIDGYCVGEPWNSVAVDMGVGHIVTTKSSIWPASPDKVLGARDSWAERNAEPLAALIRALWRAAAWAGEPRNWGEAATLLADETYLGHPAALLERALSGRLQVGGNVLTVPAFFVPAGEDATFPRRSDALWFYSQMVRWGEVQHTAQNAAAAAASFRPDIYRAALAGIAHAKDADAPASRPHTLFDGRVFDPTGLDGYIANS